MEIMKATTAHEMTIKVIEDKRNRMLENMNTCILNNISLGKFERDFIIDSPALQDELFDYFTAHGYAVRFSQTNRNCLRNGPDSRIMTISWEDAIQ